MIAPDELTIAYRNYVKAQYNAAKTPEAKQAWMDLWNSQKELEGVEITFGPNKEVLILKQIWNDLKPQSKKEWIIIGIILILITLINHWKGTVGL